MSITLEQHAPRARCYVCGSTVTTSLCHHCGKVMCGDHSSRVVDEAGKPLSEEFTELGLEEPGGYHCYACAHTVRGRLRALIAVGVAVAVLGVIVTVFSVLPGVALLLVGAGLAAYGYFADKRRRALALESRPLLPLVPNLDFASVSEVLHGKLSLSQEGMYESRATPVEGKINIAMTLAMSDRELLKRYRKKYRLTDDDGVKFSAGFAVLAGEVGLDAVPNPIQGVNPIPGGTGMSFGGKIAGHPFFTPTHSQSGGHWNLDLPYKLQAPRNVGHIPLWLTPALLPESDQRTLELDLQWMKLGPLDMDRIESIVLDVPGSWGHVESVAPPGAFITEARPHASEDPVRKIEWELWPQTEQPGEQSVTLTIHFEEKVNRGDTLRGRINAVFGGQINAVSKRTLSGIEGIDFYDPLGHRREGPANYDAKTAVSVEFELSLTKIRYQDTRVVPDRSRDTGTAETDDFPGVIPDYETVIELTNELSDQRYYVKRVIENPPRSGGRAGVVNRYWDIAGRRYEGVYPIDFHITLTGEEIYRGDIRAEAGNTTARITVQGTYANPDMEHEIEQAWERLHDTAVETLQGRVRMAPTEAAWRNYDTGLSGPQSTNSPEEDGKSWTARSRERLDAAVEALLEGRISEEMYREIKAREEA